MATASLQIPVKTGLTITQTTVTTGTTLTVSPTTASGAIRTDRLVVYFQASTSVASSIEPQAGGDSLASGYSAFGQGDYTALAIPTSEAVIAFGGKEVESARMLDTSGNITFYNTGGTVLAWAVQLP
jgi:hypothetical protein